MEATPSGPEQARLSRDLSEFLVELSIALHRHAMYPQGHPSLAPAVSNVVRRAEFLLETRSHMALGVARDQLVIEGVATDPKHPVLRDLAARLHGHQLGALTITRGLDAAELASVLRALAVDGERSGQPLGRGPRHALEAWPHVRLHAVSFERLDLVDEGEGGPEGGGGVRGAQLWIGLARAALADEATEDSAPPTTEPTAIARAIDAAPRSTAYDQVIVGYLLQIAGELQATGSAEAALLRRRVSRLIAAMRPETLRRLVDMGGDAAQRQKFVLDATHGMAVDAVLEIVRAAAGASGQTVSHGMLRMLAKMAHHAAAGAEPIRVQADTTLREQVRALVRGWTLPAANPEVYDRALEAMTTVVPAATGPGGASQPLEPLRVAQLALELDYPSPALWRAVSALLETGGVGSLAELLERLPAEHATARALWSRLADPAVVRRLLAEPVDFATLDRVLPHLDLTGMESLFDALAASVSRTTRRGLLDRVTRAPVDTSPLLLRGLQDERWYVQRNMLVLLGGLPGLPDGFSASPYQQHPDARVRREALKLRLSQPAERDAAIAAGVADTDATVVQLALIAAQQGCPSAAVSVLVRRLGARGADGLPPELRTAAIKPLGRSGSREALEALLRLTNGGRTWLGRLRLPPKSPELVAALLAIATGWRKDGRARAVLQLAAQSPDAEIRTAAGVVA